MKETISRGYFAKFSSPPPSYIYGTSEPRAPYALRSCLLANAASHSHPFDRALGTSLSTILAASYALFTWLRKWLWFCALNSFVKVRWSLQSVSNQQQLFWAWIAFGFCSFECICLCSLGIEHRRGPLRPNFYVWKKFLLECALFRVTALLRYRRVGSFSHPLMNCFTLSLKDPRNLLYCIVTMELQSYSCSF